MLHCFVLLLKSVLDLPHVWSKEKTRWFQKVESTPGSGRGLVSVPFVISQSSDWTAFEKWSKHSKETLNFSYFCSCTDKMEKQIICWKAMMNESCGRRLLTWGSCWTATSSNWASSDRGSMSFLPSRSCVTHTNITHAKYTAKNNNDNNNAIKIPP